MMDNNVLGPVEKTIRDHSVWLKDGDAYNDFTQALAESKLRLAAREDGHKRRREGLLDNYGKCDDENDRLESEKAALEHKTEYQAQVLADMETSYEQHYMDKLQALRRALGYAPPKTWRQSVLLALEILDNA